MCEEGCVEFDRETVLMVLQLKDRLQCIESRLKGIEIRGFENLNKRFKRIEDMLKNHEMILVEKVI